MADLEYTVAYVAAPATTADVTISDASFGGGTPEFADIFSSHVQPAGGPSTEATSTHAKISLGVTDGTTEAYIAARARHNSGTASTRGNADDTKVVGIISNTGSGQVHGADYDTFVANGVRLNQPVVPTETAGFFAALLGGSRFRAKVVTFQSHASAGGDMGVTGAGFRPNLLLLRSANHVFDDSSTAGAVMILGYAKSDGSSGVETQCGFSWFDFNGGATADPQAQLDNNTVGRIFGTPDRYWTIQSFDSDGFTMRTNGAAGGVDWIAVCIECTTGVYLGIADSPTTTGVANIPTGTVNPAIVHVLASHLTAVNTLATDASAGAWGYSWFTGSTSDAGAIGISDDDGASPTDAQTRAAIYAINSPDDTGAESMRALFSAWTASPIGVNLNWSYAPATATKLIVLAFAASADLNISKSESITVSEFQTVITDIRRVSVSESVAVAESVGVALVSAGTVTVSKNEAIAVSEAVTVSVGAGSALTASKSETITVGETVSLAIVTGMPARARTRTRNLPTAPTVEVYAPLGLGGAYLDNLTHKLDTYQHTVEALGGYWAATITMPASPDVIEEWLETGLGRRIVTRNPEGQVIWEGFVDQVGGNLGGLRRTVGPLLGITNQVKLIYSTFATTAAAQNFGIRAETGWSVDTDSATRYGTLETILSSGGVTATDAQEIVDTYLGEHKNPEKSEEYTFEGGEPSLTLECLGYVRYLERYVYNSTSTGTVDASSKVASVATGSYFSTSLIDANTLQVAAFDNDNRMAWNIIKEIVAMGDSGNNRWLFGVYGERQAVYRVVSDQIDYVQHLRDPRQRLSTQSGQTVRPWDVQPGRWLFFPDLMVGRVAHSDTLRTDPRAMFIESVNYTMPHGVTFNGNKVRRLDQKLARLGLGGI